MAEAKKRAKAPTQEPPAADRETAIETKETIVQEMLLGRAAYYRNIYSNTVKLAHSNYDLKLVFCLVTELEPGKVGIEEQAAVFMSPYHAKSLYRLLGDLLGKFEAKFGEVADTKAIADRERKGK